MSGSIPEPRSAASPPDWEALARFLSGESDAVEQEHVRAWLAANPDDHRMVEALSRLADQVPVETPAGLDVEAALRRTRAAAGITPVIPIGRGRPSPLPARAWWHSPVFRAAAVIGVAAIGTLLWSRSTGNEPAQVASETTYRTAVGQVDSISLSDGSRVVLAPGSELAVSGGYGTGAREVRLSGQGWFDVVHDDARPFVVRTATAEVRDVGTRFTVTEREAGRAKVAVHEGAVLVRASSSADAEALLHEGDEATVEGGRVASTSRGTLARDAADWVSGMLHFRDVPLGEVAGTLRAWYGVDIRVTDSALAAKQVTIDVNAGSLGSVGQELGLAVDGIVRVSGDTVVISRK
jgi:transmembrane sensor